MTVRFSGASLTLASPCFLQALFAALLYLLICWRRWWGWLLLVPALPVLFFAQLFGYQLLIPTLFLVESDPAPETGDWPRVCELEGQWLDGTGASADLAMERAGEVWLMAAEARRYSILRMPDCRLQPIAIPAIEAGGGIGQVWPGGGALYQTYDKATQKTEVYVLPAGHSQPDSSVTACRFALLESDRDRRRYGIGMA